MRIELAMQMARSICRNCRFRGLDGVRARTGQIENDTPGIAGAGSICANSMDRGAGDGIGHDHTNCAGAGFPRIPDAQARRENGSLWSPAPPGACLPSMNLLRDPFQRMR